MHSSSPGSAVSQHPVSAVASPRLPFSGFSSGCSLHPSPGRYKSVCPYLCLHFIPHVHYSRMQTLGSERLSTMTVIRNSITLSGFPSLYAGLSASLLRQLSYSLVRLGAYERFKAYLSRDRELSPAHILFAACLAGGLGGLAGNPAGLSCLKISPILPLTCFRHHPSPHDQRPRPATRKTIRLF